MSGHNRWTKIKRKKEAMGATKGKLFNKIIKELTVAARLGGGDPAGNARLRVALDLAKEANMPSENIQRAVKKGTGELEGTHYEEVRYEGYGPAGVAVIVECLTDNRSRTVADIRAAFSKGGGNMAAEHAVSWMFHRKGSIAVKAGPTEDKVMEAAIEAGASDIAEPDDGEDAVWVITTAPVDFLGVKSRLEAAKLPVGESRLEMIPLTRVTASGEMARELIDLVDALEDLDDVQKVYTNFDVDDATLAAME